MNCNLVALLLEFLEPFSTMGARLESLKNRYANTHTHIYIYIHTYLRTTVDMLTTFWHWLWHQFWSTAGQVGQVSKRVHTTGELSPTLQSTVIPAWNYAPQLRGKVTPTSSLIVNAAPKCKTSKNHNPKLTKHHENASHPNGFKLGNKISNKII